MPEAFKFPDELEEETIEISANPDADIEIEVVDDTPERDRGRKPLDREVADPTDDEIENYSDGVKKRIKELTHARHDERRVKEATMREKQELERMTQHLLEENKKLKGSLGQNQAVMVDSFKKMAARHSETERADLFRNTAARFYRLTDLVSK